MTNREQYDLWRARRDSAGEILSMNVSSRAGEIDGNWLSGMAAAVEALYRIADSYDVKASEDEYREEMQTKKVADAEAGIAL